MRNMNCTRNGRFFLRERNEVKMRKNGMLCSMVVAVMAMVIANPVFADPCAISWWNFSFAGSGTVSDHNDVPIVQGDGLTGGGFLQLIWTGADETIDPATNSGDGTTNDDVVRAVWYIDGGTLATDGEFYSGNDYNFDNTSNPEIIGDILYVRAWEDESDGYTGALTDPVPSAAQYYGDSPITYTVTGSTAQDFDLSGSANDWSTTTPIPEPGTISLMVLGFATIGLKRKLRK